MYWDREKQEEALLLDTRRKIYEAVRKNPGIHLRELQRLTGLAMGQLEYHLDLLERVGLVRSRKQGRYRRYFPADSEDDPNLVGIVRSRVGRAILEYLLGVPRANHEEIAEAVGVSPSTLTWHMKRLADAGIVERRKAGRHTYYALKDRDRTFRLLLSYTPGPVDKIVDRFVDFYISSFAQIVKRKEG